MFNLLDLDNITRQYMIEEVDLARSSGNLYFSKRFNESGMARWAELLREAVCDYNEHWLAYQIEAEGLMKGMEATRKPSGGYTAKHVAANAAETLADGQFVRFYILGVCRRSLIEGKEYVYVYRGKVRAEHRIESDLMIGKSYDVQSLIGELRSRDSSLGHDLLKPNSGLCVRL
jgi:hypothetical protein